jgi:hypothetical protein
VLDHQDVPSPLLCAFTRCELCQELIPVDVCQLVLDEEGKGVTKSAVKKARKRIKSMSVVRQFDEPVACVFQPHACIEIVQVLY